MRENGDTVIKNGCGILTHRKVKCRRIGAHRIELRTARIDGRQVEYRLHDQGSASSRESYGCGRSRD